MTLRHLLLRLHAEYGSWKAIADKMGCVHQVLHTGLQRGTFSIEMLFRLAELAGESPGDVLRGAGKADVAEQLERLYGAPHAPLSDEHRDLLSMYDRLPKHLKRAIVTLLKQLSMRGPAV